MLLVLGMTVSRSSMMSLGLGLSPSSPVLALFLSGLSPDGELPLPHLPEASSAILSERKHPFSGNSSAFSVGPESGPHPRPRRVGGGQVILIRPHRLRVEE